MTEEEAEKKVDEFVNNYINKFNEKNGVSEQVWPCLCGALQAKLINAYMNQK